MSKYCPLYCCRVIYMDCLECDVKACKRPKKDIDKKDKNSNCKKSKHNVK